MKKSILLILVVIIGVSCKNSKPEHAAFDLSAISFKDSIQTVMKDKNTGLKVPGGPSGLITLGGYKAYESADPRILTFDGINLAGSTKDSVNKVIFHYAVTDSLIGLIEVKLFSEPEVKALTGALDKKLGKAPFPEDAYTTVLSKDVRYYERTWVDPKTSVAHFLTVSLNEQDKQEARMAIVDYSNDEMCRLTSLKAYTPSVPFYVKKVIEEMQTTTKK